MDSQVEGDQPTSNPRSNPPLSSPLDPTTGKANMPERPKNPGENQEDPTKELRREFRWFEVLSFGIQLLLAIVGIRALYIYGGQLQVMQRTLDEMKRSGSVATNQTWQAIGNMNWLARTTDEAVNTQAIAAANQNIQMRATVAEIAKLANATQESNKVARQATEAQTRPWIDVEGIPEIVDTSAGLSNSSPYTSVLFNIRLRNYGNSPAVLEQPPFVLMDFSKPVNEFFDHSNVCNKHESRILSTIFPNAAPITRGVYANTVESTSPVRPLEDRRWTFLGGCIVYKGSNGGGPYYTRVIYRVLFSDEITGASGGLRYRKISSGDITLAYIDAQ
jgi:hypothetical protein